MCSLLPAGRSWVARNKLSMANEMTDSENTWVYASKTCRETWRELSREVERESGSPMNHAAVWAPPA